MKLSKWKQFLICTAVFAVLGAAFKVMVLVEGFTEVRPVNAVPMLAGLSFGFIGALGCGIGNIIADIFGTFNLTSILGLFANFVAAYLPFKLWHLLKKEEPNVHTWKNIGIYVYLSALSALTASCMLGFGLYYFFGPWIETIYTYVLFNNFGFSVALGLPLFIVLTSDSVNLICAENEESKYELLTRWKKPAMILYTLLMIVIAAGVLTGWQPENRIAAGFFNGMSLLLLLYLLL